MAFLLLALLLQQQPASAAPPRAAAPEPGIEWAEAPFDVPRALRDSVRFGYLSVPRDHADSGGERIRVAFAVVAARTNGRLPDPVVILPGGPGVPGIESHMRLRMEGPHPLDPHRERRDLIILDPRGHGLSEPATCSELSGGEPVAAASGAAERVWLSKLAECRGRLRAAGVRLETLSAVQVAHDLELLRRALGAPQLNLIGLSYGSRLAAEAVRRAPSAIRAVYYSAPVPPGRYRGGHEREVAEEVLGALFRRCAAQPECRAAYPRLEADFDTVIARARRAPLRVPLPRSDAAPEGEVVVDEDLLRQGLAGLLVNRELAAGLPLLIRTIADRGGGLLEDMAPRLRESLDGPLPVAPGTHLAFWCNDGVVSRTSPDRLRTRCRAWLGDSYDDRAAEPVRSDVPALIVTGELDPRTPPSYARFLAAGMSGAHLLITPWYGHERPPDCEIRISRDFFDAPEREPDGACLDSVPPIEFVTGVVPSRSVGRLVARAWRKPWLSAAPAAAAVLLLAVPAIGIPVREMRARRRGRPRGGRTAAGVLLLLVAALGLAFLLGLAVALVASARRHFFIPLIGLPAAWAWLLVLPWLLLALTPVAAFLALRGRSGGAGEPPLAMRWSTLLGAALVLGVWYSALIA